MLRALFADPIHAVEADGLAKKFGPLWNKYLTPEPEALALTGYSPEVRQGSGRLSLVSRACRWCSYVFRTRTRPPR
jgi:hypothetical protein